MAKEGKAGATSHAHVPGYPAARLAAARVLPNLERVLAAARGHGYPQVARAPGPLEAECIIDAAFWASLRREEGYLPKISLAYVAPDGDGAAIAFERPLPLAPESLVRLAAAVERPGIHLGVWPNGEGLAVWGATRLIPPFCFVLEVVAPGLLVVKHRRGEATAKFANVAVLEGDRIKVLDQEAARDPDCPHLVGALIGLEAAASPPDSVNVFVELAASMRAHGRGGLLLVAPAGSDAWRESIVHPIRYSVQPPFSALGRLMREDAARRDKRGWQDALHRAVEGVAGLTAVDGAAVIDDRYEVLAFGAKIRRREGHSAVEHVLVTEPVQGAVAERLPAVETGGTRHMSAAQFAFDQRDALALVASQDGRFTVFEWSPCEQMVHAHRIESLLL